MSAHTPGPWQMSYDNGSTRDIVASPDPLPICTVRLSYVTHEQYAANARLIAEAPVMLALLKKAEQLAQVACDWNLDEVEIDGQMVSTYDLRDQFLAVLARIEGGAA